MNDTTVLINSINTCDSRKSRHCFLFSQATAFRFHDNHGTRIVLSDNQQTAERTGGKGSALHGIVMSRDPMQFNHLYEVNSVRKIRMILIPAAAAAAAPALLLLLLLLLLLQPLLHYYHYHYYIFYHYCYYCHRHHH